MKKIYGDALRFYLKMNSRYPETAQKAFTKVPMWCDEDEYDGDEVEITLIQKVLENFSVQCVLDYDEEAESMVTSDLGVEVLIVTHESFKVLNKAYNQHEIFHNEGKIVKRLYRSFMGFYNRAYDKIHSLLGCFSAGIHIENAFENDDEEQGDTIGIKIFLHEGLSFYNGSEIQFVEHILEFIEIVEENIHKYQNIARSRNAKGGDHDDSLTQSRNGNCINA